MLRHGIIRLRGEDLRAVQAFPQQKAVCLLRSGPDDDRQQAHEIIGEIPGVSADLQLSNAVFLADLPGLVRQLFLKDLLSQKGRVLVQQPCS